MTVHLDSDRIGFIRRVQGRLTLGAHDVAEQAKRNLGGGSGQLTNSVRVEQLGPTRWKVGSNHPGAMAQERGAYIRPRPGGALKYKGRYSMHSRIKPKKWLSRAARRARYIFRDRLKGAT